MSEQTPLVIALAGNPNAGKTTIFNALTGTRQHVGNYPGVTVTKKEGIASHKGVELKVVDLPGTYSLTAYSIEEVVARTFVIEDQPDVVVDIIDSSNLERNLYLATQFLELGVPVVLAFNMADVAASRGFRTDTKMLSELFGVPIVQTVGTRHDGIGELLDAIESVGRHPASAVAAQRHPTYGAEIEPHVRHLTDLIERRCHLDRHCRWYAVKCLEGDRETAKRLRQLCPEHTEEILAEAGRLRGHVESVCGDSAEIILADRRYGFISGACTEAVTQDVEARHLRSDRIDAVLTHRVLGLPIFAMLMYLMFQLTFTLGQIPMDWIEAGVGWLGGTVAGLWPDGSDDLLRSLLVDGVINGAGGVLTFVPNIMLLFAAIALLEDSGYMARAAFIMDRVMHKIGLHGKSFIPLLTGFGCSIPAIMATRTLEGRRDRLTTMLVVPLMSCGARLPIYALIIPVFYARAWRAPVLFSIYIIGILLAIVCAKLLRATLLKGESTPFVMELPPYRVPTLKGLCLHVWERTWMYLRKAGTIILAFAIVLWALTTFPRKTHFDQDYPALAAEVAEDYLAGVRRVQAELAFSGGPDGLAEALSAGSGPVGEEDEALAAFVRIRRDVVRARADLADVVAEGEFEPGTPAWAEQIRRRDAALAEAKRIDPAIYPVVIRYLDEVEEPRDEQLAKLANDQQAEQLSYTMCGRVGRMMEPAIKPTMGFDWRIGTALVGALGAKEVFVAQLGIVYSVGEADGKSQSLRRRLRADYKDDRLTPYCIMLFCLITAPCMATIAVTWRESHWRWALLQLAGLTVLAFMITTIVYQVGSWLI